MSGTKGSNSLEQGRSNSTRFERSHQFSEDGNSEVRRRPVLYAGVVWMGILRRFLIPRTCGSSLPRVPHVPVQDTPSTKSVSHTLDRSSATQLTSPSLLTNKNLGNCRKEGQELRRRLRKEDECRNLSLPSLVVQLQETSATAIWYIRELSQDISGLLKEGRTTTSEAISILRSEDAVQFRWTVITLCGLVGYLGGLRRGTVTKVVYSATGATAMASICYPHEAQLYNSQGLLLLRQFIVYGITLIRDGLKRGPANEKEDFKDFNLWELKQINDFNENKNPNQPFIDEQANKTSVPVPPLSKNILNLRNKHEQINSITNHSQESYSKTTPERNIPNSSTLFKQEPPVITRNSEVPNLSTPTSGNLQENFTFTQTLQENLANQEQKSITEGKNKSLHSYSSHGSSSSDLQRELVHIERKPHEVISENHSSNMGYHLFPVPEPTLEIEEENISRGTYQDVSVSKVHPLNKKLSRYYVQQPDKSISSNNKGYDDLYAKRN